MKRRAYLAAVVLAATATGAAATGNIPMSTSTNNTNDEPSTTDEETDDSSHQGENDDATEQIASLEAEIASLEEQLDTIETEANTHQNERAHFEGVIEELILDRYERAQESYDNAHDELEIFETEWDDRRWTHAASAGTTASAAFERASLQLNIIRQIIDGVNSSMHDDKITGARQQTLNGDANAAGNARRVRFLLTRLGSAAAADEKDYGTPSTISDIDTRAHDELEAYTEAIEHNDWVHFDSFEESISFEWVDEE